MQSTKKEDRSKIIGILLVIIGGVFLLKNFDLLPMEAKDYLFNWKGIVLAIGLIMLGSKSNQLPGMIMIAVSSFFIISSVLAQEFNIHIHFREIFIPIMLIMAGLVVLRKRMPSLKFPSLNKPASFDHINDTCIFGGGDKRIFSDTFKGGQATAIFGGGNYDMTGSTLAEGHQVLEIFALFGGFTFIFPSHWDIQIEVTSLFGGINDKRKFLKTSTDQSKRLRIKGFVIFGGGELKNY